LRFVHQNDNNQSIMSSWFEKANESFDELEDPLPIGTKVMPEL